MNPLNYASLEASRKLVDAGIILGTEVWWKQDSTKRYYLRHRKRVDRDVCAVRATHSYPAPTMAEVWRELPHGTVIVNACAVSIASLEYKVGGVKENTNPTDALIDLLIWVRKEAT